LQDLVARLGPLAQAGAVDQAIAFGDVIFIAVPYGALPQIGKDYGKSLAGKIVLDANNAVASRDGDIADEVERNGIGGTSQKYLPGARLVRAFNTLSYTIFEREANRPQGSRCRLRAMIRRQSRSLRNWSAMPALIRWKLANWPMRAASSVARQDMARM
jgi:predicted dinucleotide-binding enzyme